MEAYAWTGDGPKIIPSVENFLLKICVPVASGKYKHCICLQINKREEIGKKLDKYMVSFVIDDGLM